MRRRRASLLLLLLTAAVAATALAAAPASAAEAPAVEYSTDGTAWSATPPASLFPADWAPAPGDSRATTLYLRATRPGDTILAVFVGNASATDPAILAGASLRSSAGEVTLSDTGCADVVPQTVLAQGDVAEVPLTLALSPDLTAGAGGGLGFDLLVDLSETGPATLAGGCPVSPQVIAAIAARTPPSVAGSSASPAPGGGQPLAGTGADTPIGLFAAAAVMLVGGILVHAVSRTRPRRSRR
jgi:hypothetical protein